MRFTVTTTPQKLPVRTDRSFIVRNRGTVDVFYGWSDTAAIDGLWLAPNEGYAHDLSLEQRAQDDFWVVCAPNPDPLVTVTAEVRYDEGA